MKSLGRVQKYIVAAITAALTWTGMVLLQPHITAWDWYLLAVAEAGALGVYAVPNTPKN